MMDRLPADCRKLKSKNQTVRDQIAKGTVPFTVKRLPANLHFVKPSSDYFCIVHDIFLIAFSSCASIYRHAAMEGISYSMSDRGHHPLTPPCPASKAPSWKPLPP